MTLDELVSKFNGKYLEYNQDAYKNQCKDLWGAYNDWVLGYPYITGNANQMHDKMLASGNWYQVSSPEKGDVATWDIGDYGHIAIYYDGRYFSQNYPLGKPCILVNISNNNLIGWLRPRKGNVMLDQNDKDWLIANVKNPIIDNIIVQSSAIQKKIDDKKCTCGNTTNIETVNFFTWAWDSFKKLINK